MFGSPARGRRLGRCGAFIADSIDRRICARIAFTSRTLMPLSRVSTVMALSQTSATDSNPSTRTPSSRPGMCPPP